MTNISTSAVLLEKNFRPPQELNGRTILSSFKMVSPSTPTADVTIIATAGANGLHPQWALAAFIVTILIMFNYSLN